MTPTTPPRWCEHWLSKILDAEDLEVLGGDLLEEFRDRGGDMRAARHYERQAIGIFIRAASARWGIVVVSGFLTVALIWFTAMELILRHPAYQVRSVVTAMSALLSALLVLAARRRLALPWRTLRAAAMAAGALGLYALVDILRGPEFEGYVAVIGLALMAQAALTALGEPYLNRVAKRSASSDR